MLQRILHDTSPILHLSFFTGIGISTLALQKLNFTVLHTFWWEIDETCISIFNKTFDINHTHMGDIWDVDPKELAEKIRGHLLPNMIILSTAAPPCKDHSKIRDAPPGVTGQDGSLLQHTVDIELSLRQLLPEFRFETLMENVIPHDDVQSHFDDITDQWGSQPIVCDAADGNMVSRPRLWWNTIHWPEIQNTLSTQTPWQLTWQKHEQYDRLYNPIAAHLQPSIHIKDWETPNILTQGGIFHALLDDTSTNRWRKTPPNTCKRRPSHLG